MKEDFSYDACCALYDHLEELGQDIELDPIELRCTYTWYPSLEKYHEEYKNSEDADEYIISRTPQGVLVLNH